MAFSKTAVSSLALTAFAALSGVSNVDSHGYLSFPKPRNIVADETGYFQWSQMKEALNNKHPINAQKTSSVCGSVQDYPQYDMDNFVGGSQATYNAGDEVTAKFILTVSHYGHLEFSLCPASNTNQACFKDNVLDVVYHASGGADPAYPKRAMFPPQTNTEFEFRVKLPDGLPSGEYVLKMTYVTANSCYPEGYSTYKSRVQLPAGYPWNNWSYTGGTCSPDFDVYSVPPHEIYELFHNCVDVTIVGGGAPSPTPQPTPSNSPPPTPKPTAATSTPPAPESGGSACCSGGSDGWYAANQCKGFVYCNKGVSSGIQLCPSGLLYNGSACDWPSQVTCANACTTRRLRTQDNGEDVPTEKKDSEDRQLRGSAGPAAEGKDGFNY